MFCPKSILIYCLCVLFSLLAFGLPKENSHSSCGTGDSSCLPKTTNVFQLFWNKSLEATFRYKIKLISVTQCKPNNRLDPSNPLNVKHNIRRVNRDTTLLDVEVQTNKKVGPLFISCRGYTVKQNSIRDLIYRIDKVPCSHRMMVQFLMILNVTLDNCMIEPGVYTLNNINMDSLSGALSPTIVSPGIYAYELEFYHSKGVLACITLNNQIMEKRKSKP